MALFEVKLFYFASLRTKRLFLHESYKLIMPYSLFNDNNKEYSIKSSKKCKMSSITVSVHNVTEIKFPSFRLLR